MNSRNPLAHLASSFRIDANKPAATESQIDSLRAFAALPLPQDYVDLVLGMTEVEILVRERAYIRIWGPVRALEMNQAHKIQEHIPASLAIGDDEGDSTLVLMNGRHGHGLYLAGFGELDPDDAQYIAPSLSDLLVNEVGIDRL